MQGVKRTSEKGGLNLAQPSQFNKGLYLAKESSERLKKAGLNLAQPSQARGRLFRQSD